MKRIISIIWGAWCAVAVFISPMWLIMIFLNLTGIIYKYDYSMDEGTALIIGIFFLVLWLILALLPVIAFIKKRLKISGEHHE